MPTKDEKNHLILLAKAELLKASSKLRAERRPEIIRILDILELSYEVISFLDEDNKRLEILAEYGRHKEDCNPKPWENDCKCGYLQALKGICNV